MDKRRYNEACVFIFIAIILFSTLLIAVAAKQKEPITSSAAEVTAAEITQVTFPYEVYKKEFDRRFTTDIDYDSTQSGAQYINEFNVSAYCPCAECCGKWAQYGGITASGAKAAEGVTVGADLSIFPFGTHIWIDGIGERIVQDTGSGIKGYMLDLYFAHHQDALNFGRQQLKVYILE